MPGPSTPTPANSRAHAPGQPRPRRLGEEEDEEEEEEEEDEEEELTEDEREVATSRDDNDGFIRYKDVAKVPGKRADQPRNRRIFLNFLNGCGWMLNIHKNFNENWRELTNIEVCVCCVSGCVCAYVCNCGVCVSVCVPALLRLTHAHCS